MSGEVGSNKRATIDCRIKGVMNHGFKDKKIRYVKDWSKSLLAHRVDDRCGDHRHLGDGCDPELPTLPG